MFNKGNESQSSFKQNNRDSESNTHGTYHKASLNLVSIYISDFHFVLIYALESMLSYMRFGISFSFLKIRHEIPFRRTKDSILVAILLQSISSLSLC